MDKKKLIGTIIGVVAFIALVAGATYAWSQAALNVTGTAYNGKTMNFIVDYVNGTAITTMPPTLANSAGTTSTSSLTVTASRPEGSTPGKMTIYLNTTSTSNTLLTNGVLTYGYCITDEGVTTCSSFAGTGTITTTGRTAIITNTDLVLKNLNNASTSDDKAKNYNIYFWLDGAKNQGQYKNQQYAGYIEAVATQTSN